jgi:hypothetical protein
MNFRKMAGFLLMAVLAAGPVLHADDERAKALEEYQSEVNQLYSSSNTDGPDFYARMEREAEELETVNDYIQWAHSEEEKKKESADKPFKPLKSGLTVT